MNSYKIVGIVGVSTLLLTACGATPPTLPIPTAPVPSITSSPLPTSIPTSIATPSSTATATPLANLTTDKNPGQSINPLDKGKTLSSDTLRYTLLDVREDQTVYAGQNVHVILVKLEVENIIDKPKNLSLAQVRLVTDPNAPLGKTDYIVEFLYPRSNVGTDLAGDVTALNPGEKVTGYYIYTYEPYTKLYFNILNLGNKDTQTNIEYMQTALTKAGTFNIK